jgi:hypothetical protein
MCRKLLVLLALITALAISVGVFVAPAEATSQPTCSGYSGDGNDFVGWQSSSVLGTGSTESANVADYGNAVQSETTGNVRGEVRVDNGWQPETAIGSAFIEAGVITTTSGDRQFIEYKSGPGSSTTYTDEGAASVGTVYATSIKNNGSNSYTAKIGSHSLTVTINNNGYPMQGAKVVMENQQRASGTLCDAADMSFTSVSANIISQVKIKTDTTLTKFDQFFDHASASFTAYSPWVGTPCNPPGPCLPTG